MARSGGVWRFCCGWLLLCCLLPAVEAATRRTVDPGTPQSQVEGATATSIAGGLLNVTGPVLEGEYIAAGTKNVPVRGILGGTSFGLNTIIGGTKSLLKGGLQAVLIGAAIDTLLKGVNWVMTDGVLTKPAAGTAVPTNPSQGQYYWTVSANSTQWPSAYAACQSLLGGTTVIEDFTLLHASDGSCRGYTAGHAQSTGAVPVNRFGNSCPAGSTFETVNGSCLGPSTTTPVLPADIDGVTIDQFVNAQNSDFVKNLLKDVCKGSINPGACYTSMRNQALALKGPSSVDAGTTTSTTTTANSNGTTSNTVTTTNTKYNIVYGPTYFDSTKNTTTTVTTDGKPTSTTGTSEDPTSTDEDPADDKPDDPSPSPCSGTNCDGPAYTSLYTPSTDKKETTIDSFSSRISKAPIIAAASGFFTVSASAGCPVWQVNTSFAVFAATMPINLVFDEHCQSWFVSIAQYGAAVMQIVCAYLAFRQAFLD